MEGRLRAIRQTSTGDGLFLALDTEAKVYVLARQQVRRIRYWLQSQFIGPEDVLLDTHNPNQVRSRLAEFYVDAASQVVNTWIDENGHQYVRPENGTTGGVGGLRLVEFVDDYPFVRMR